jgi:putative membrane protein
VGVRFLDDDAAAAFKRAVETVEQRSAAEIVVAIRQRSDRLLHTNLIVGTVVAFAGLAFALYSAREFSTLAILLDPFLLGFGAAALVELLPDVKRVLTSRSARAHRVAHAAHATFVERGVHNTTRRGGLLVYISWLERQVALVADSALDATWPADQRARAEAELSAMITHGGVAFARRLEALADELARALPHHDGDVNELPDAVDSDLRGRS